MIISVAKPEELDAALALAVGRVIDRDAVEVDGRGVFVARDGGVLCGAICCQPTGGAAALLSGPRGEAADELIAAGLAWLRSRGVRIVQAMAAPINADVLVPLGRHGFVAAGPMNYLRQTLGLHHPRGSPLRLRAFDEDAFDEDAFDEDIFARTLERTYIGSQDFPELMNVQSIDEILAGYLANPAAKTEHWFVVESAGGSGSEPVGVLMLTEVEPIEHWELTYLGIVPERRRQGLGRALVGAAMDIAHDRGGERLEVAVDARNLAARQLYSSCGFQLVEHRLVSLAFLSPSAEKCAAT